jgi:lysyl-tRNA synthetase class II
MQQLNKRLILSLAALLVVCGSSLSGGAVLAEHGGNSGSSENETKVSTTSTDTESETEVETQHSDTLREQFRAQAKAKVESTVKAKTETKTHEQKQQACSARKANLTKRMNNSVAAAERHKAVFDKIYTRVQNFYTDKKLNVANYDTLKTSADTAKQDAADQIAALKSLDVTVDCTQADSLATNISAFQSAVKSTRDSLKAYRKSLVDLITALHGASTSTDKTGGTSTDDSTTNSTTTQ